MTKEKLAMIFSFSLAIVAIGIAAVLASLGKVSGDTVLAWILGILGGAGVASVKKANVLLPIGLAISLSSCGTLTTAVGTACGIVKATQPVAEAVCRALPEGKKEKCLKGIGVIKAEADEVIIEFKGTTIKVCPK